MVNMGMGQKDIVHIPGTDRQFLILIKIRSLLHPTVNQYIFSACFQKMTTSGHFMGSSNKAQTHITNPFFFSL